MNFYYTLTSQDIKEHMNSITEFYKEYKDYFRTRTREVSHHGLEYIKGLFLCDGKRNMNNISEQVTELNEQSLSHFISNSPWKEDGIIKKISNEATELFSKSQREKSFIIA
jgi:hypothetical protein